MAKQLTPRRVDTELSEPRERRIHWPQRVAVSTKAMISTAHYRATEAGVEVLEAGGNAFDAAVAAAFALGVCEPAASGLGGQTMALLHEAASGRTIALDGSSRAPNRATVDRLSAPDRKAGHKATTVPSTPAVLRYVLERFGKLKLGRILQPAIRLAEEGYEVTGLQRALARRERESLRAGTAAALFLRDGRKTYPVGSIFKQPVLAETLRRIAKKGVKDFYSGEIAAQIEQDMIRNDGLIRREDLAQVPRPLERHPLTTRFQGHRVFTFPPPAAGRTLIQTLNVYQELPEIWQDPDTPQGALALAEVIRRAFIDRQDRPFDPNFYPQISEKRMLRREYARLVATQVLKRFKSQGETTHLSVMDDEGNAVALTQSIEKVFGSCAAAPELGFLYNNYMGAFEYENYSHPYYLRPNAVPWASVAPSIVFRGRRPYLVIGSPGSERITSAILQVLIRLENLTPFAAVDAPRLHCSLEGKVSLEGTRMRSDIPEFLERHGFAVDIRDPYSFYLGCIQLVMRDGDELIGVADPRRDGSAAGPGVAAWTPRPEGR
ncbi:MAG TPA: gamma-glutamyltransferase [Vicinamibacteria bacterium]|nr:gamma-glutamyltransferase [Vicinamibacteria bacterium]